MNKDSSVPRCQACDRVFKTSADLDRHLRDKHEDTECPNCKKSFSSRKQADNHICLEGDIVPQICSMPYCKKEFVSSAMLNKHVKNNHYGHQRDVCTKCGEMINKNIGIKKHLQSCGKGSVEKEDKREKSREVCYHWKEANVTEAPNVILVTWAFKTALSQNNIPQERHPNHAGMVQIVATYPRAGATSGTTRLTGTIQLSRRVGRGSSIGAGGSSTGAADRKSIELGANSAPTATES